MAVVRFPTLLVLACAACGLDAVGTLAPSAGHTRPPDDNDGGGLLLDAGPEPMDGGSEAESGVPVGNSLCDPNDPDLLACFGFEGAVVDDSQAQLVPDTASDVTFVAGHEGTAAFLTLDPMTDIRLPEGKM